MFLDNRMKGGEKMKDPRKFIPLFQVVAPGCHSVYTVYIRNDSYDEDKDCSCGPALMWSDESIVVWIDGDGRPRNTKEDKWHLLGFLQDQGWELVKMEV